MHSTIIKIPVSKNLPYFWIVFSMLFGFQFTTAAIANYFNPDLTSTKFQFDSLIDEFFIAVIIAPIVETLIFQYAVIETLLNSKVALWVCIVISGLLFGLSHWYNLVYVLVTTIVGVIFAYYYMALRHQSYINKFAFVIFLHALSNAIAFINKNLFDLTN